MAVPLQAEEEKEPGLVEYNLRFNGGEVTATFNSLNGEVIRQLLIMSYLIKEGEPYQKIDVPLINGRQLHLKLNLNDPESRVRLKKIADSYEEVFHNKFVIARMDYLGGNILAVFNSAKEDVIAELQKLNEQVDEKEYFVEQTFGLLNGTDLKVKLNLNEKNVRDALKKVALKYSDTPSVIEPNHVTVNMPYKSGTAVGIFDINKLEVINALRILNHDADETQPFIVQTFELWNGEKFSVKLNMDNKNVRKVLKSIAVEYHELQRKVEANLYKMTFADGKIKGTFDLNKEKLIETLTDLDKNVDVNKPYEIKRIPLENGAVIYVRINTNDRETIKKLKEIANDYEEEVEHIPNIYEVIDLPYLSNIARAVVNVGKDDVLQKLKNMSDNVKDELYAVKNIHLHNGTVIEIKLGINDLLTLGTLRRLSDEYEIIANNTDYRYTSKTLPFSNGTAIAVFDVSDSEVIERLQNLDKRIVNPSYQANTEFRLFDGSVLSVLLDTNDPATRETLRDIAVRYEECIESEVSVYVNKSLTWSGGEALAVFDLKRPEVLEGLRKINSLHGGDPTIKVYDFPSREDSILRVKLDLENPEIRAILKTLTVGYKEYIKPYVPNFTTLNLEWEKGRVIGVYDTNKPSVIQGLRDLNDPAGTDVKVVLSNNVTVPIKVNLKKRKTREVLRLLAEQYEEYVQPYLPHHVIQILSSKDKLAVGVFDTNNPKVIKKLQNLDYDGQVYHFPLSNGTSLPVTLDINNPKTVTKLKKIAEKFDELHNANYVTVRMPFTDGSILAVFDMNKPEVISGLNALNNATEAHDESSTIHPIPLNHVETLPLKLNLRNPKNRKALQNLAEEYEEFVFPKFNLITKLLSWNSGSGVAVFDTHKPDVIAGLNRLYDETGKVEVFPLSNGKDLAVSLNLNDPNVRGALSNLSETYKEYAVPTFVPQTLEFGGLLVNAIYDVSKPEVVSGLKDISSRISIGEPIVQMNFSLIDGEHLEVKYNPNDLTVRNILHGLALVYQEIQEPNYVGASIDFDTGKAAVILDLNKADVLSSLKRLDEEVNSEEPIVSVNIPVHPDEFFPVKLNMDNPEIRDTIQEIAEHYKEILYPHKSNLVSFELPFEKGFITVTLDSFNQGVVEELRRMTAEADEDSPDGEVQLESESFMPFKINTDDLLMRQRLQNIAHKYREVIIDKPPDYVIKILPYYSGKLVAVLDVNKKEVGDTLQMLNDMVDESKPYIKERIRLSNDSILNVKLNIDDRNVRDILCGVAHDCDDVPHNIGPKYVSHNMPFEGGIAMGVFDVNKLEVIKGLIYLQDKVADGQANITRVFPLNDGSVLQVKLDIDDLETRRALQMIAEKYEEVPEPRRSRTIILELPFKDGLIISTFDVSNDEVIEKLKTLTSPYNQESLLVDIPLVNGSLLNLNFNINDPQIRNAMRNLAIEYQEIFDPLQPRHVIFKTPFSDGEIVFVIDIDREAVMKKLQELGKHLDDKDSYVILRIPLENGTVVDLKIDPNDPDTREALAQISVEYNEVLNSTDPHLSQHHLRYDTGRIFVTFDTSDPNVIKKLKDLDNQVRKSDPYVTIKILLADGSVELIKLNIDDPEVRSKLKAVANNYKQISRTGLPHHFTHSHYQLPFNEGSILMTLQSDDPKVLQVLGELHHEASKRDSPFTLRIPLPDGSLKQFKLDLNNISTRQTLQNIAERYKEVIEEQPLTKIVNYEFPLEENKKLRVSLDLAKKKVVNTLLELSDETGGDIIDLHSDEASGIKIKLDVRNPYTQRELKRVANRYELVNDRFNKPTDEAANLTYRLPFKDGNVIAILNPYDPEVISELMELNNKVNTTQRRVTLRLPLGDDENFNIRLNIDNPETREVLKRIAIAYSEATNEVHNNIIPYQLSFNQGTIEFVLDMSDPEVIETLLRLSEQVEETDKHELIQIPSIDGENLDIKLNLDDPSVRSVLKDIGLEYKISWRSPKHFTGSVLNLLQFRMPFEGGKFTFTIDPQNKTVIEGLREISRNVDVKKPRIATKITLADGSFLNVRLNPDNTETRDALKKIVIDYEEIFNDEDAGTPENAADASKSVQFEISVVTTEQSRIEEPSTAHEKGELTSKATSNQGEFSGDKLPGGPSEKQPSEMDLFSEISVVTTEKSRREEPSTAHEKEELTSKTTSNQGKFSGDKLPGGPSEKQPSEMDWFSEISQPKPTKEESNEGEPKGKDGELGRQPGLPFSNAPGLGFEINANNPFLGGNLAFGAGAGNLGIM